MAATAPTFGTNSTGNTNVNATQVPVDRLFAELLGFAWKGVAFPATTFEVNLRHDLATHKFADRDGAHIEATGRVPLGFTAKIPFFNTIAAAPSEGWEQPLYPKAWRAFLAVCADRATGVLRHPELGFINCKLEHARTVWDAKQRAGVEVECSWIESTETPDELTAILAKPSPAAAIANAAQNLDFDLLAYQTPDGAIPKLPQPTSSFGDLAFALRGVIDTTTLASRQIFGKVDKMLAQAQALEDDLEAAPNALAWPILREIARMRVAANDIKTTLLQSKRAIRLYPVPAETTLAGVANDVGADLRDVMTLNVNLLAAPVVPKGVIVRCYANPTGLLP